MGYNGKFMGSRQLKLTEHLEIFRMKIYLKIDLCLIEFGTVNFGELHFASFKQSQ